LSRNTARHAEQASQKYCALQFRAFGVPVTARTGQLRDANASQLGTFSRLLWRDPITIGDHANAVGIGEAHEITSLGCESCDRAPKGLPAPVSTFIAAASVAWVGSLAEFQTDPQLAGSL